MKLFLKSLPVFLSFLSAEFIIYFFLSVSFQNDFTILYYLKQNPLVLRIPVIISFVASCYAFIKASDQKHIFLAIFLNFIFLFFFVEVHIFHSIPNPFLLIFEFFKNTYYNFLFLIKKIT
jgi:hypothetical protein